jgi:GTP cyclohydrolase I
MFRDAAVLDQATPKLRVAPPAVDQQRLANAVREILIAIGEDPDREGLVDTPHRVAKAWAEQAAGLREDPARHLRRTFAAEYDGLVVVRGIEVHSLCEHHLLPFTGRAAIAYLPGENGRVVGLSKLARLVAGFARRPQVQERLTRQVADALERELAPRGLAVAVNCEHSCMRLRGVRHCGASTLTTVLRGALRERTTDFPELADVLARP